MVDSFLVFYFFEYFFDFKFLYKIDIVFVEKLDIKKFIIRNFIISDGCSVIVLDNIFLIREFDVLVYIVVNSGYNDNVVDKNSGDYV